MLFDMQPLSHFTHAVQNERRNSVLLTLKTFVNAQSECGFHLKPI